MGPARFHCATLLSFILKCFFAAQISKSSQMTVRAERVSAKVGMIGTQDTFKEK